MSRFPTVGPQPAASPVSTYSRGEFREPGQSNLGETLAAFSEFNKNLQVFAKYRAESQQLAAEDHAKEYQSKNRIANMKAFAEGIESGTIPQGDSPWFQVYLRKLVARDQARDVALSIDTKWREAKMSQVSDEQAAAWFDQETRGLTDGLDSYTASDLNDAVNDIRGKFIVSHHQRATEERENEGKYQTGVRLLETLHSAVDSRPDGVDLGSHVEGIAQINTVINDALMAGMTRQQMRESVVKAASSMAEARGDVSLFMEVLNTAMIDGRPIGFDLTPDTVQSVEEAILDRIIAKEDKEKRRLEDAGKQTEKAVLSMGAQWIAENPKGDILAALPGFLSRVPEDSRSSLMSNLLSLKAQYDGAANASENEAERKSAREAGQLVMDLYKAAEGGETGLEQGLAALELFTNPKDLSAGVAVLKTLTDLENEKESAEERAFEDAMTPENYAAAYEAAAQGDRVTIYSMIRNGLIPRKFGLSLIPSMVNNTGIKILRATAKNVQLASSSLALALTDAFLNHVSFATYRTEDMASEEKSLNEMGRLVRDNAQKQLQAEYADWVRDNPFASHDQAIAKISEIKQDVLDSTAGADYKPSKQSLESTVNRAIGGNVKSVGRFARWDATAGTWMAAGTEGEAPVVLNNIFPGYAAYAAGKGELLNLGVQPKDFTKAIMASAKSWSQEDQLALYKEDLQVVHGAVKANRYMQSARTGQQTMDQFKDLYASQASGYGDLLAEYGINALEDDGPPAVIWAPKDGYKYRPAFSLAGHLLPWQDPRHWTPVLNPAAVRYVTALGTRLEETLKSDAFKDLDAKSDAVDTLTKAIQQAIQPSTGRGGRYYSSPITQQNELLLPPGMENGTPQQ